ncbi:MAG TPA: hypothetical protein VG672_07210 [Bryobacteraceae bacterium]|jgi:type IV pilus assembly protein PilM|nr:hypothetical protein [Bryobacteraceae bacterium]
MNLLHSITALLQDAPPALAFEISEGGISMARIAQPAPIQFRPLAEGVLSVSPLRDNVLRADELAEAVRGLVPPNGNSRKRRDAIVILPDYCARISVLDFDQFPSDAAEQMALVRFRVKKSLPFDVESAAVSYWVQPAGDKRRDVVAVAAPLETVARYEAPFRAAGLNPGMVTLSAIAALDLVHEPGISVVAKLTGRALTVMVLRDGALKLVRCLELAQRDLEEVASDLFPTFVFVEDSLGAKADRLLLCGFGPLFEEARQQFESGLGTVVEPVRSPLETPGEENAGLLGYLKSIAGKN